MSDLTSPPSTPLRQRWIALILIALALALVFTFFPTSSNGPATTVDYSVFYAWVESEHVESVVINKQILEGELKSEQKVDGKSVTKFRTTLPADDKELIPTLREKEVRITVSAGEQNWVGQVLGGLLPWILIIVLWVFLARRGSKMMGSGGPFSNFLKSKSRKIQKASGSTVSFDDVAGLKAAKRDLQEVVQFLKEPDEFQRLGAKVPRGVLLVGPPGTGKTLLARAVAGESEVPFYRISGSEFIEMFVGVGAARVRDLFAEAKKDAPSIVFIDEIDAVGRSRGAGLGGGHDEREQTLNQLLSEMDGFDQRDQVIVLAATNRPDVLDPALLRPGRFDRRVMVDRPEVAARAAILDVHCRDKPVADEVDLQTIAANTAGFSGADLANLVNEAALNATRRGADDIEPADFSTAFDKIVLGDPRESKLSKDERLRVAVHEAGHATVSHYSEDTEPLHRVSIIPRGVALGVTQQTPAADRHLMTQAQLDNKLRALMGGYAAERLVLGDVSTGAENDLKQATDIASNMVAHYGMSKNIGPVYVETSVEHPFLGHRIATESGASDATVHAVETELRALLRSALNDATKILIRRRSKLDQLVEELLRHETLEAEDLEAIFAASAQKSNDSPRVA